MPSKLIAGARAPGPGRRPRWRRIALHASLLMLLTVAAFAIIAAAYVDAMRREAPDVQQLKALQQARPSVLMSADGQVLTQFRRAQQERVPLARVSPHVVKALLATEDHRFYEHRGVDVKRTLAAAWHTLRGDTQGGSTITQQLARNLFPEEIGRERTLDRKVKELITALRIERAYDKPQILEKYLNNAAFLYNVVGIEMAARTYYDKPAAELDVLEAATLIGMLKGTRYYNPVLNPERAQARRNVVLQQMVRRGALAPADYEALRGRPLQVRLNRQPELLGPAPHFAVQLRKWLIAWADEHDYNLYTDGLVVHTTIDSRLQAAALDAVARQAQALQMVADVEWSSPRMRVASASPQPYAKLHPKVDPFAHFWRKRRELVDAFVRESPQFKAALKQHGSEAAALRALAADATAMAQLKREKTRLEAGFVAIDPQTGEVKAWVGSRDFDTDQYDHVAQAVRQPGSTFKPFVYGAALESGLSPYRIYVDEEIEVPLADGTVWRPTDMAGASGMPMFLRDGLVHSKNTITAQVAQEIGIGRIVGFAQAMGVDRSKLDPVPSLALGTSPVTLLEMVSAYATIAGVGQHRAPLTVRRITDRHGAVLAEFGPTTRRAMAPESAVELIEMMRGVVQRGTGTEVRSRFGLGGDIAGKTGTTQNNTDGWFILMHPKLVAGAWVGFNDSRVTMRSDHWGQGGHNAILLVGDFFRSLQKAKLIDTKAKFPPSRLPPPPPLPEPLEPYEPVDPQPWGTDTWSQQIAGTVDSVPPGAMSIAPSGEVLIHSSGAGHVVIGDRAGIATGRRADGEPPKSADELGRVMINMGRDPATGAPNGDPPAWLEQDPTR